MVYENYPKNKVTQTCYENYPNIRVTDRLTYKDDDIGGYASSRLVATKVIAKFAF